MQETRTKHEIDIRYLYSMFFEYIVDKHSIYIPNVRAPPQYKIYPMLVQLSFPCFVEKHARNISYVIAQLVRLK